MEPEIWKEIKGYEGLYRISNYGRIWSIRREKILKLVDINNKTNNRQLRVGLCSHSVPRSYQVARLVYLHFKGKEVEGMVEYLDGNYKNLFIGNLKDVHKTTNFKKAHCYKVEDLETGEIYESILDLGRVIKADLNNLHYQLMSGYFKDKYKIIK